MVYRVFRRFMRYLNEISAETALDHIQELNPEWHSYLLIRYEREGEKPFRDSGWSAELINALDGRVAARTRRKEFDKLEEKV